MIYRALKEKGHDAILLDVYLGYEDEWKNDSDMSGVFGLDRDWAKDMGLVTEKIPISGRLKPCATTGRKISSVPM